MNPRVLIILVVVVLAALMLTFVEVISANIAAQVLIFTSINATIIVSGLILRPDTHSELLCDPLFLFCLFLSQFFIIGPVGLHVFGANLTNIFEQYSNVYYAQVLVGFMVLMIMVFAGYQLRLGEIIGKKFTSFSGWRYKLPGRWIEIALLLVSLGGCFGWIEYQGGLIERLSTSYGAFKKGHAIFTLAHMTLLVATLILAWRFINAVQRKKIDTIMFISVLIFDLLYFGIVQGARKSLFHLFFGIITIYILRKGIKALPKVRTTVILILLLLFFSFWGVIRSRPVTDLIQGRDDVRMAPVQGAHMGYLNSVAEPYSVTCLIWGLFPEQEPFRKGSTLNVTLLGFIPRAIWPNKPVGIGKELTKYVVGPFYEHAYGYSIAPTILGDSYVNFGWFGVVLGGLFFGVLCRSVSTYAREGMVDGVQYNASRVLMVAVFNTGLVEVRAAAASMLAFYIMMYLPLIIALFFFSFDFETAPTSSSETPATVLS